MKQKVAVVIGTRPEAIKLAPLVRAMRARADSLEVAVIFSGQHENLVRPILDFFAVAIDHEFKTMREGQSLADLHASALLQSDSIFAALKPDWVVVQGDTTTAMCAALAGFYQGRRVAHLEAGLRTGHIDSPFPEEVNRRVITQVAQLHWAPTPAAAAALRAEGQPLGSARVLVTGNTVIDALLDGVARVRRSPPIDPDVEFALAHAGKVVLITGHRRESFGAPLRVFCEAIADLAASFPEVLFLYPVHPNPQVRLPVYEALGNHPNVRLTAPKNYPEFLALLDRAALVVTDSGGVQEEAPALGKRVLVTRAHTERPEGIASGHVKLVGGTLEAIHQAVTAELTNQVQVRPAFPYGDGHAAPRCVASLLGESVEEFGVPASL